MHDGSLQTLEEVIEAATLVEADDFIKEFKEKISAAITGTITRASQPTPPRNETTNANTAQRIKKTFKTIVNNVMVKPFPICLMR